MAKGRLEGVEWEAKTSSNEGRWPWVVFGSTKIGCGYLAVRERARMHDKQLGLAREIRRVRRGKSAGGEGVIRDGSEVAGRDLETKWGEVALLQNIE